MTLAKVPTQGITITYEELLATDISTALEFYDYELKWEPELNYRNIYIKFVRNTAAGEQPIGKEQFLQMKLTWYRELIQNQPTFLYFLVEEEFNMYLHAILYREQPSFLLRLVETGKIQISESGKMDNQLKNFILESIEDLQKFHAAPVELMYTVYREVAAI